MKKLDKLSLGVNVFFVLASILLLIIDGIKPAILVELTQEDGWFEASSAIFYLVASGFCLLGLSQHRTPRRFWAFWCLLFAALSLRWMR